MKIVTQVVAKLTAEDVQDAITQYLRDNGVEADAEVNLQFEDGAFDQYISETKEKKPVRRKRKPTEKKEEPVVIEEPEVIRVTPEAEAKVEEDLAKDVAKAAEAEEQAVKEEEKEAKDDIPFEVNEVPKATPFAAMELSDTEDKSPLFSL